MSQRVVVVGGGIGGAAAAYALRQRLPEAELIVLEASDRVGGKLHRIELAGVRVDAGAESMLARRPEALELIGDVGLDTRLINPATTNAALWTRGALRAMPPTVMGIPADVAALAASGVVSEAGIRRLDEAGVCELPADDVSVGGFVAGALGDEVCDRLIEPLLGGVYAGHARSLSLRAAAPQVAALAEHGGSLVDAAAATLRERPADSGPLFAGLEGGVGQLVPAALSASTASVRLRSTVRELVPTASGWRLLVGPTTDVQPIDADAVVLATPAAPTARLLAGHADLAARELRDIEYANMAIVSLAVPRASLAVPDGSGFLVPPVDGRVVKAATFSSSKWAWIDEQAGDDLVLLRASIGRAGESAILQRPDDELVASVLADLGEAVGLEGKPVDAHVQRWGGGLPQYAVGHLDRVRRIEESVSGLAGVELCGAAYHGVGIPAVIATAKAAAERVAETMRATNAKVAR